MPLQHVGYRTEGHYDEGYKTYFHRDRDRIDLRSQGDLFRTGDQPIPIGFTHALDGNWLVRNEMIKTVQYENIDPIRPENYQLF